MRIGELSASTGASVRSIRHYESQDLLASERSSSGQRHFTESSIERVRLIRQLLAAGLTTATIAEVLPCVHDPDQRTPWLAQRLRHELDRIDSRLDSLRQTRQTLAEVLDGYANG